MKQFMVSLYARSRTLHLVAITRLLGVESSGGHERGTLAATGDRSYLDTFWWVDSGVGDEATMEAHTAALVDRLAPLIAEVSGLTSTGALDLRIGVGIMYDTYTTSVCLPPRLIALAAQVGASVEVSSYPTEFDSPSCSLARND